MRQSLELIACVLMGTFFLPAQVKDVLGIPPRAAPADYQASAKAGAVTIAADFTGHSVPGPQGALTSEDYVMVEVGLFGAPDARMQVSGEDFSLRINGAKKAPLPSQPFGLVFRSLKDPEWEPPTSSSSKSKGGISGGGGGGQGDNTPPPPPKMPIELQRAMQQRVQKAALPEGDRPLPHAGLLFFPYRGKVQSIRSVELIYSGSAGKAVVTLQQ